MPDHSPEPSDGVARLVLDDWATAAQELGVADHDPATAAVFIDAAGDLRHGNGIDRFLRRLETVSLPTVCLVGGTCDASALAVLAAVSLGFVTEDVAVSVDAATVLDLGLASSLPAALGSAPARGMLFATRPLEAAALRSSGLARIAEDPAIVTQRLAVDPSAALLVRSLRVAARASAEQARRYDTELRKIR